MTPSWHKRLTKLVEKPSSTPFPLCVFDFNKPTGAEWPQHLPHNKALQEFYALCNGGLFSMNCDWYPIEQLAARNESSYERYKGYNSDGTDPLIQGRHLVFAHDAGGSPYIWDSDTGAVYIFWFKGAVFEKLADSFEDFVLQLLFRDKPNHADDLWYEALQLIDL